jgi:hypothetical protein
MKVPGAQYRPNDSGEGLRFCANWCRYCQRDRAMREGCDIDECDDDECCEIIANTAAFEANEDDYPKEWTYDANGEPCCTAYVPAGNLPRPDDDLTLDLFT